MASQRDHKMRKKPRMQIGEIETSELTRDPVTWTRARLC